MDYEVGKELVTCAVCGKAMTMINNRHLQSHNLTAKEYKDLYPTSVLRSIEVENKLRARSIKSNESRKGKPRSEADLEAIRAGIKAAGPRKGRSFVMTEEQKALISATKKKAFAEGQPHPNLGRSHPQATRSKISATLTGRVVGPEAAMKAVATKRSRGVRMGVPEGYRHTVETKQKIAAAGSRRFLDSRAESRAYMSERIRLSDLVLHGSLVDDVLDLECLQCHYRFTRTPQIFDDCRWQPRICDQCYPISKVSVLENEIASYIENIISHRVIRSDYEVLGRTELDIYVPELSIAFEVCGLYWHSELAGKQKFYHRQKMEACNDKGIRLVTIFEDEWVNKAEIVQSMIDNALGLTPRRIHARKCDVRPVESEEANAFLLANHVMGRGRSNIRLGLYHEDELVSVMTFADTNVTHRNGKGIEMNRFCSALGTSIMGGGSRLFKHFVREHDPRHVTTYADLRWGTGAVYDSMGFRFVGNTIPNYFYFLPNVMKRYHRFALRLTADEKQAGSNEWEARKAQGYNRIYDCGHAKWVWDA